MCARRGAQRVTSYERRTVPDRRSSPRHDQDHRRVEWLILSRAPSQAGQDVLLLCPCTTCSTRTRACLCLSMRCDSTAVHSTATPHSTPSPPHSPLPRHRPPSSVAGSERVQHRDAREEFGPSERWYAHHVHAVAVHDTACGNSMKSSFDTPSDTHSAAADLFHAGLADDLLCLCDFRAGCAEWGCH